MVDARYSKVYCHVEKVDDNRKYQKKVMSRFFLKMLRARLGAGRSWYYTTIMSAYSCDRGEEIASLREKLLLLEESKAKLLEKASKIKNIELKDLLELGQALR